MSLLAHSPLSTVCTSSSKCLPACVDVHTAANARARERYREGGREEGREGGREHAHTPALLVHSLKHAGPRHHNSWVAAAAGPLATAVASIAATGTRKQPRPAAAADSTDTSAILAATAAAAGLARAAGAARGALAAGAASEAGTAAGVGVQLQSSKGCSPSSCGSYWALCWCCWCRCLRWRQWQHA